MALDLLRSVRAPAPGPNPFDTEDEGLKGRLLVTSALTISVCGVVWGLLYIAFGEPLAGAIPLAYTLFSLTSVGV
jgi:hypothetical protein